MLATLDLIEKGKKDKSRSCEYLPGVFTACRSERNSVADPRAAITQLLEPNSLNPISLIGISLPNVPETIFSAPVSLTKYVEPSKEDLLELNLTPKFCLTDLHIGEFLIFATRSEGRILTCFQTQPMYCLLHSVRQ